MLMNCVDFHQPTCSNTVRAFSPHMHADHVAETWRATSHKDILQDDEVRQGLKENLS